MAGLKTRPSRAGVRAFLAKVSDERKRKDAEELARLMRRVTGKNPRMWGPSIVGFGSYHYVYPSGHEGDAPLTGFSPRKHALVVYLMPGFNRHAGLVKKLGRVKAGKGCLYIKNLDDVDRKVLEQLIRLSVRHLRKQYKSD